MTARAIGPNAASVFDQGCELLRGRDVTAALSCIEEARRLGFDPDRCAAQTWFCHMLLGEFEGAWRESDDIAGRGAPDPHAWWDRKPIDGGSVMVRCLHGLGDTIQFIRYAALLRERVDRIVVSAPPTLVSLLETIPQVDQVCGWDRTPVEPPFDRQLEVTEFPLIFRTTVTTVPNDALYFDLPTPVAAGAAFRVGLCWKASDWDNSRSLAFENICTLRSVPGVEFSTLQFGDEVIGEQLADPSKPVLNTALAIQRLDLVISVDTMVAHLAGALGKPVWIMLPFAADWRWMLRGDTSPWYPSARLFRQRRPGEWSDVIERVSDALREATVQRQ